MWEEQEQEPIPLCSQISGALESLDNSTVSVVTTNRASLIGFSFILFSDLPISCCMFLFLSMCMDKNKAGKIYVEGTTKPRIKFTWLIKLSSVQLAHIILRQKRVFIILMAQMAQLLVCVPEI